MVEIFSQEATPQILILHRHVIEEVGGVDADVLDLTLLQAWVQNLIITYFLFLKIFCRILQKFNFFELNSSSRSSTPEHYKNTPEGQQRSRTPSPEKGLMEKIMEKKEETVTQARLNQILQQLEDPNAAHFRQGLDFKL